MAELLNPWFPQPEETLMMNDLNTWFVNNPSILVLSVPILSGLVGWMTVWYTTRRVHRSAKERMQFERLMKISEFRQSWINSLRDCMAEFQSHGVTPNHRPGNKREFYRLGTKIELLMNPNDPDYSELQSSLYKFLQSSEGNTVDKFRNNSEYIVICQQILKREWDRLKEELNDPTRYLSSRG